MKSKIIIFAVTAFLLNFFWESWHAVYLYSGHMDQGFLTFPIKSYLTLITRASFVDALMLLLVLLFGAVVWKNIFWFEKMTRSKYLYFVVVALAFAVFVEIKGVFVLQQWSYNDLMPTIFGLGLSPLLQLPVTGLLSLWIIEEVN